MAIKGLGLLRGLLRSGSADYCRHSCWVAYAPACAR